jgi:hypothetical protein
MSIPSYFILFLFTAQVAFAYTVVLTSGKRIEGTLVSDQQSTIVIKDSHGVLISFKKSMLDLVATSTANEQKPPSAISFERESRKRPASIVEIALETKSKRRGKARTITASDIENAPEISILGFEDQNPPNGKSKPHDSSGKEWQRQLWFLKKEVNRLREKKIATESSCEQSKEKQYAARTTPSRKPVDLISTYSETTQCRRLAEVESQLSEAETRLENMREEARRAGVSWQSLE